MVCIYNLRKVKGTNYVHLLVCLCMCSNYDHIRLTLTLTSQLTIGMIAACSCLHSRIQNSTWTSELYRKKTWMKTTRAVTLTIVQHHWLPMHGKKTNKRHRKERPYLHTIWDWSSQTYSRYSTLFQSLDSWHLAFRKKNIHCWKMILSKPNPKKSKSSCWMLF